MLRKSEKGGVYLECLIAILLIVVIITPTTLSFYNLKRGYKRIENSVIVENEIEKIRGFYKKNRLKKVYLPENNEIKVQTKTENLYEKLYKIVINVEYKGLKRESSIYVYE